MTDREGASRGRRIGYLVAAAINLLVWFLANVSPGWQAVPFLSEATVEVLPLFNVSVLGQFAANLAYAVFDSTGLRRVLEVVLSGIALALSIEVLVVFPFAFDSGGWEVLVRVVAWLAVLGTAIALVTNAVRLVKWLVRPLRPDRSVDQPV